MRVTDRHHFTASLNESGQTSRKVESKLTPEGTQLLSLLEKFLISLSIHRHLEISMKSQVAPSVVLMLDSAHQESQTWVSAYRLTQRRTMVPYQSLAFSLLS